MARKYAGRTYTLPKALITYLDQRCSDGYSRSAWVREACLARMELEMEEARRIVQRRIMEARRGKKPSNEGIPNDAADKAISNFRTSMAEKLAETLLHSEGEIPCDEMEES